MNNSSEWDDLFAIAAGGTVASEGPTADETSNEKKRHPTTDDTSSSSSPRKKAKKGRRTAVADLASGRHQNFLSDRLLNNITNPLQLGFQYGASLLLDPPHCHQAKFSTKKPTKPCKRCGDSRFRHKLMIASPCETPSQLDLYCELRNLRHLCFLLIKNEARGGAVKDLALLQKELQRHRGAVSVVHQNVKIRETLQSLMNQLQRYGKRDSPMEWDEMVQLIIACDTVYYELYYTEITTHLGRQYFVPHPTVYFGESLTELSEADRYCRQMSENDEMFLGGGPFRTLEDIKDEDPLSTLHHVRLLETIQVFHLSGWLSRPETKDEFRKAARQSFGSGFYEAHETPAPPLLSSWRDSCRDFLTHLYAYATIPKAIRDEIHDFVKDNRVVDVGAGTGYLASLLARQGVTVDAMDRRPGQQNDYHGSTPTFLPIQAGDGAPAVPQQHSPFVLLLCYPPPDSSMAVDTLRQFLKQSGNRFIHVGEFKGLTGTAAFERLLTSEFTCTGRFACPTWGTDAASVTFWKRKERPDVGRSVLLPCAVCGEESKQRLRLIRYLCYCSASCWKQHARGNLPAHMKRATVEVGSPLPEFGDKDAFLSL